MLVVFPNKEFFTCVCVYVYMCVYVSECMCVRPSKCAYILTLLILIAEGAPGNPGMQVLNAATSEKGPLPQELIPHTLNLYALPDCNSTR